MIFYFRVLEQKKVEYHASIERTKELEKLSLLEQKKTREDKQRQTRLTAIKVTFSSFSYSTLICLIRILNNDENNSMKIILKSMNVVHQHRIIDQHQHDNELILAHHHFHLHHILMKYLFTSPKNEFNLFFDLANVIG
jgi:hypothetical protein